MPGFVLCSLTPAKEIGQICTERVSRLSLILSTLHYTEDRDKYPDKQKLTLLRRDAGLIPEWS